MHPVVELLMARMDSNPEEFIALAGKQSTTCRWHDAIYTLQRDCNMEDGGAFFAKLGKLRLNALHNAVMSELCAPPHPVQEELWSKAIPTPRNFTPHSYEFKAYGVQVKNGTCTVGPIEGEDSGE